MIDDLSIGANSRLASMAINHLLGKYLEVDVVGLARSEEEREKLKSRGVEIQIVDYFDKDSLENTFDDEDVLAFIVSGTLENRMGQQKNN